MSERVFTNEALAISTLFHILDKEGKIVDFKLNESQQAYEHVRSNRDLIPKARQKGFSAYGVALQTIKCLGVPGTRAVLISHEANATQRLLDRAQFYLRHIKGPQAELGRHSRNELYFPKTESTYYIGTAGARAFGRGDTITDLHISEYAWWENSGIKNVAGLMQAVPGSGCIRIESTGNGMGNDFYYMCKHAPQLGYNVFFRSWHDDLEYSRPLPQAGWDLSDAVGFEDYFARMQDTFKLSLSQCYWYWCKLLEFRLDLKMMQQEYPSSFEECFQATGGQLFQGVELTPSKEWKWRVEDGRRVEYLEGHPLPNHTYILGADPSGGTGNDEASYIVICMETQEEVEEFGNSGIDPVDFGTLLCKVGKRFNEAFIACEGNNHGIATHNILKKNYPRNKLYKKSIPKKGTIEVKYGWQNNEESKHALVGFILEQLPEFNIYGQGLKDELSEFQEDPESKKMGSSKDNRVIAFGLCCLGFQRWERFKKHDEVPKVKVQSKQRTKGIVINFDEVLKGINDKRTGQNQFFQRQVSL